MRRALAVAAVLAALCGCNLEQDVATRPPAARHGVGTAAPPLRGRLVDGAAFDLAADRGHPGVVDFFASWCGPCHGQQAGLDAVASRHAGRVVFVGVDIQETDAEVRGYEATEHVPYPALLDSDGSVVAAWAVPAPPMTVVVDGDGRVARTFLGSVTEQELEAAVAALPGS